MDIYGISKGARPTLQFYCQQAHIHPGTCPQVGFTGRVFGFFPDDSPSDFKPGFKLFE
jgi:hypothetical protein